MFSDNVNVIGSDHKFDFPCNPIILSGRIKEKVRTVIGDDVWLGHGVVVMRGCKIGNGAIVGANAVVTKDIEAFGIYAGVPAKKIGDRFAHEDQMRHGKWLEKYRDGKISINPIRLFQN